MIWLIRGTTGNIATISQRFRQLIVAIATSAAVLSLPTFSKPAPTTKTWLFEQQSKFLGAITVYASPKGIRINASNKKWFQLAKAPSWDLYMISPDSHLYYRWELKKWRGHPLITAASRITRDAKPAMTNETQKIAGLTTVKYVATSTGATRSEVKAGDFWVCRDLKLPEQISHVMCGNIGIPQTDGIPLGVLAYVEKEKPMLLLKTISARTENIPDDIFDLPRGYKLAHNPEEIMMDSVTDLVKDFAGDLNGKYSSP